MTSIPFHVFSWDWNLDIFLKLWYIASESTCDFVIIVFQTVHFPDCYLPIELIHTPSQLSSQPNPEYQVSSPTLQLKKDFRLKISRFICLFTVLLVQFLSLKFCWKFLSFFFNNVCPTSNFTTSFLSEMTQSDFQQEIFNNLKTLLFL